MAEVTAASPPPHSIRLEHPALTSTPVQLTAPIREFSQESTAPIPDISGVSDELESSTPRKSHGEYVSADETTASPNSKVENSSEDDVVLSSQATQQTSKNRMSHLLGHKNRRSNQHPSSNPQQMAELPLTASMAEVEEAYKKALAEQ